MSQSGLLLIALGLAVGSSGIAPALFAGGYNTAVLADHPVAYYSLDEPTGTFAQDLAVPARAAAQYHGGVTLGAAGPRPPAFPGFAATNRAASFDEVDDYLDTSGSLTQLNGNAYSFELWFEETFDGGLHYLGGRYAGGGSYQGDSLLLSGALIFFDGTASYGSVTYAPDVWHQVVLTRNGATVNVYLDGKPVINATAPAQYGTACQFVLGTRGDLASTTFFKGQLDELSVYDTELTAAQVAAHFAAALSAAPTGKEPAGSRTEPTPAAETK